MTVSGAIHLENVVAQSFTDYVWLGGTPWLDERVTVVSSIFTALRHAFVNLDTFYTALPYNTEPSAQPTLFPRISAFTSPAGQTRFEYLEQLGGNLEAVFKCTTLGDKKEHIVVKFVRQYNLRAHQILAEANLAPKLLFADDLTGPPTAGGMWMVVMEYVDGRTLDDVSPLIASATYKQIEKAIGILHEHDIVFGDLRPPNIIVRSVGGPVLVDFDWCSKHSEGKYPADLNQDIKWHPDVEEFGLMRKEHDIFMLGHLKPK